MLRFYIFKLRISFTLRHPIILSSFIEVTHENETLFLMNSVLLSKSNLIEAKYGLDDI